jgi:hypothetical protein
MLILQDEPPELLSPVASVTISSFSMSSIRRTFNGTLSTRKSNRAIVGWVKRSAGPPTHAIGPRKFFLRFRFPCLDTSADAGHMSVLVGYFGGG